MAPRTRVRLLPGEWASIASYFEVGMVPDPEDYGPGFLVDGILRVLGVVARHRPAHHLLEPPHAAAWALFCRLRREGLFPSVGKPAVLARLRVVSVRGGSGTSF